MIPALFLSCALSLPSASFTRPAIVSWQAVKSEADQLNDFERWFKKNNPDIEDVYITPKGQEDKLKEYGYERAPWVWKGVDRDLEIWIQRKPKSDQKLIGVSA
jgi:hypothetical protein